MRVSRKTAPTHSVQFAFRMFQEEADPIESLLDEVHAQLNAQRKAGSLTIKKGEILQSVILDGLKNLKSGKIKLKRKQ